MNILSNFQNESVLYMYPILKIQKIIMDKINDKFWVIMFRRVMIKLSCLLAKEFAKYHHKHYQISRQYQKLVITQ